MSKPNTYPQTVHFQSVLRMLADAVSRASDAALTDDAAYVLTQLQKAQKYAAVAADLVQLSIDELREVDPE